MANWVTIPRPDFAAWEVAAGWDDQWAVVPGTDGIAIVEQPLRPCPEPTQFELAVRPFRQRAPWQHVVSHRGLFLVGANHGEWGGKLRLYSRWGEELASLSNDAIVAVVDTGPDTAVSLHGINHMRVGEGEVAGWRWHDGAVAKAFSHALDGGVCGYTRRGEEIFLTTPRGLWRISGTSVVRMHVLGEGLLCLSSVALEPSGVVWLAGRHFVLRLVPDGTGFREEWMARRILTTQGWRRRWSAQTSRSAD